MANNRGNPVNPSVYLITYSKPLKTVHVKNLQRLSSLNSKMQKDL